MPKKPSGDKKADWLPLADRIIEKPEETPNLMKRCIVDLMNDGRLTGTLMKRFQGAVAICGSSLRNSGRFNENQTLDVMKLTQIGKLRDRERKKQKDQSKKLAAFNVLVARLKRIRKDEKTSLKARET